MKLFNLTLTILIITLICSIAPHPIQAETMRSDNYTVRFGNFNITSGQKTGPISGVTLTDTVGQTAAGEFAKFGYSVKAGFQYIYLLYDFSFTISDISIDFGSLTPNSFSSQTNTLTISSPAASGYSISAFANHRLENSQGTFIADTTCDSSCSESSAAVWTNTTNTGFGFNIQGNDADSSQDIPADFVDSTYFRQFADDSLGEIAQVVMSSTSAVKNNSATVTYKVNVDGSQAAGDYENSIIYNATPSY